MKRFVVRSAILGITLLSFFQFPGHTWLQSDTQIYMPILEPKSDALVLQKDLIAEHPHVAFTLYDETAIALGLSNLAALVVTSVSSLGATIMGPAVLVFEYEPVPRGCVVPLIFLAIG